MKKRIAALLLIAVSASAQDLQQLYEKAYFLETAKGQTEEALDIYREIASTKATDENRATILKTLERMLTLYSTGSLKEKIDSFDMEHSGLKAVLRTFGEAQRYFFKNTVYTKDNLPDTYLMEYEKGFSILMHDGNVGEFRFEKAPAYTIAGITVGTPKKEVFKVLGQPRKTVTGKQCTYEEGVLYENSKGFPSGHAYYAKKGLRLFFMNEKVCALYVTDNAQLREN